MKVHCSRCQKLFEKKTRLEKLCPDCWAKAMSNRGYERGKSLLVKCLKCGEDVLQEDDKITVDLFKRNKAVAYNRYQGAYSRFRLATFHRRCFKLDSLVSDDK